jgi:superfamily I DNA/RNA helicase
MRTLKNVRPTPEQLSIVSQNQLGVETIRGAAGSGKTTTALLKLKSLIGVFANRRNRENSTYPIKILILTFNRTLRGYINELASEQADNKNVSLEILTFSKWAKNSLGDPNINEEASRQNLSNLCGKIEQSHEFLVGECEYVLGRFLPNDLNAYITCRRDGRGQMPRMEHSQRETLLNEVIYPHIQWLNKNNIWSWNDLAVSMATNKPKEKYDIIIVDECQDFSANQLRAIKNHLEDNHCLTLVLDNAQRIYSRGFTWLETGINIRKSWRLGKNYRNTVEIAKFAASIIEGIPLDDDATLPDFSSAEASGILPIVIVGRFKNQLKYCIQHIKNNINLESESIAFLHVKGGGWFETIETELTNNDFPYIDLSRRQEWPTSSENIALSTLHSAKGLEFDHVIIIGLSAELTSHGDTDDDHRLITLRRLLAMGIGRAKKTVILGYKEGEESTLINYLNPETFTKVDL